MDVLLKIMYLIGMGSIVMDNCHVESNAIVAAGAVLLEGTKSRILEYICWRVPAKKVKTLSKELFKGEVERISKNYIKYSSWFK